MKKSTLAECTKKKLDDIYLVVYAIKNEVNLKKGDYIEKTDIYSIHQKLSEKYLSNIENLYKYSYNIRLLLFKHSANIEYYDKIRLAFDNNRNYILNLNEIYEKLEEKEIYFGYTSFRKREWTLILNDLIKIYNEAIEQFKEGKIKNSLDVENYLDSLLQPLMQKLLDTELENHLEYKKYKHLKGKKIDNIRNGHCKAKIVKTMSLRDIEKTLKEIYGVKIGKDEISKLISAVSEETNAWRKRKLKPMYVFTYADCLYVPIKDDITTLKKAVYVIIGVDVNGYKEILGLWISDTESGSFWSNVFEDLKERGVKDILYMSSDGIAGFKGSLERVFPKAQSQRCVVHLVRNIYGLCPKKNAKDIIADYKKIYASSNLEEADFHLKIFKEKYNSEYSRIVKKVEDFMQYLEPLFELPKEIRKCIYTSNAVESVNSTLRKVTRGKGAFPSENSVYKVMYLRIKDLNEKWKKPIQNWKTIQLQLIELFGDRYMQYLKF